MLEIICILFILCVKLFWLFILTLHVGDLEQTFKVTDHLWILLLNSFTYTVYMLQFENTEPRNTGMLFEGHSSSSTV